MPNEGAELRCGSAKFNCKGQSRRNEKGGAMAGRAKMQKHSIGRKFMENNFRSSRMNYAGAFSRLKTNKVLCLALISIIILQIRPRWLRHYRENDHKRRILQKKIFLKNDALDKFQKKDSSPVKLRYKVGGKFLPLPISVMYFELHLIFFILKLGS
ncbi:hypothetical protein CDAR_533051 [Caerostris darwini]|uniref:Uncharacterized protein n=1 Tax=Caerostris darwini TaxID=1538125 RepID=A0AAV4SD28_9ARAC|nr:hypothetical protein CDAR_533051 [Caerostris darwini]